MNFTQYPTHCQVILIVFAVSFLLQMVYWWGIHARILGHKSIPPRIRKTPVSVVICARNEETNLAKNLPLVLEQDYPGYEVIVVDDASGDGTADLLRELKKEYPSLRSTRIEANEHLRGGKKLALTVGLKAARHEWVMLTDADCRPAGNQWLATMQENFRKGCDVVLGYGPYSRSGGLLSLVIRYDAFFIALQYLGFALSHLPYMGVGRNLAYRKEIFFKNRGFATHYDLASGDDDLFVNEVAGRGNTRVELRPEAYTWSAPEKSWGDWYYQKKRHLTTGPRYRTSTKLLLGGEIAGRLLFYAAFIALLACGVARFPVVAVFLLRLLSTTIVIKMAMVKLNEKYLLLISPLLDFTLPLVNLFMVFGNYVAHKRARWT